MEKFTFTAIHTVSKGSGEIKTWNETVTWASLVACGCV